MGIAYLILAHHQPEHLAKLVQALDFDEATFFLHIDRKADLHAFEQCLPESNRVVYLRDKDRIAVYWAGYSQVRATLNLLRAAHQTENRFFRYCLLSGADFPLKRNTEIWDRFHSKTEFISVHERLDHPESRFSSWVQRYHLLDNSVTNPRTAPSPMLRRVTQTLVYQLPRPRSAQIPLYKGSTWWALTDNCVEFIIDYLRENLLFERYFNFSRSSDEVFFHSLVKSSPFAKNISHDFERKQSDAFRDPDVHGCHFADWNAPGVPLPKVLDLSDLDRLRSSRAVFARKFDGVRSAPLRQALEGFLLG